MDFLLGFIFILFIAFMLLQSGIIDPPLPKVKRKSYWDRKEKEFRETMAPHFRAMEYTEEDIEDAVDSYIKKEKEDWDYYINKKRRPPID